MYITRNHESHYVTVVDNPLQVWYSTNWLHALGSRAGAVVRAPASKRHGPGSILSSDHMWTKFVVGSFSALLQNQHFQISIRPEMLERIIHEPLARETGQPLLALSSLNLISFDFDALIYLDCNCRCKLSCKTYLPFMRYDNLLNSSVDTSISLLIFPSPAEVNPRTSILYFV